MGIHGGRHRIFVAALVGMACWAGAGMANEINGNTSWQFPTAGDRSVGLSQADLIERMRGGYFRQWRTSNTYNSYTTTNIGGDQVNCNLTSTAIGNSSSASAQASTASPGVTSTPSFASAATGNAAQASALGTNASPLNSMQGTYGTQVGSSINGSSSNAGLGTFSSGFNTSGQALNATQQQSQTSTLSTVANSAACSGVTALSSGRR